MPLLRIFTAPGESPDLLELLDRPTDVREIAALREVPGDRAPGILLLSRSLLAGMSEAEWTALPHHVTVVASDADAEAAAAKAGRLFRSIATAPGDTRSLQACLEEAFRVSVRRLTLPSEPD